MSVKKEKGRDLSPKREKVTPVKREVKSKVKKKPKKPKVKKPKEPKKPKKKIWFSTKEWEMYITVFSIRVTIKEGKVDIRKWCKSLKTGDVYPTKKGAVLTNEQWLTLSRYASDIRTEYGGVKPEGPQAKWWNADNDQYYKDLGDDLRLTYGPFQKKFYAHIRKYFVKEGVAYPTQKGVSMKRQVWTAFEKCIPQITQRLKFKV